MQYHSSFENPVIQELYKEKLTEKKAHKLLHTIFENRQPVEYEDFVLSPAVDKKKLSITVCLGRSCFLNGAQELYLELADFVRELGVENNTEFTAKFCATMCTEGPVIFVNGEAIKKCTLIKAQKVIKAALKK